MALFDDVVFQNYYENFKGYTGNPPSNKEEYSSFSGWKNTSIAPTWEELEQQIKLLQVKEIRAKSYPTIADQLDMLWHAIDDGSLDKNSEFYLKLKQVKEQNPIPGV